MFGRAP